MRVAGREEESHYLDEGLLRDVPGDAAQEYLGGVGGVGGGGAGPVRQLAGPGAVCLADAGGRPVQPGRSLQRQRVGVRLRGGQSQHWGGLGDQSDTHTGHVLGQQGRAGGGWRDHRERIRDGGESQIRVELHTPLLQRLEVLDSVGHGLVDT